MSDVVVEQVRNESPCFNEAASNISASTAASSEGTGVNNNNNKNNFKNNNLSSSANNICPIYTRKMTSAQTRGGTAVTIGTKPTLIEVKPMRFLIMDAPRQANLHVYMKEMSKHHVTDVVRVCEPTYQGDDLCTAGIGLHDLEYKDGTSPPTELIERWLQLVERTFFRNAGKESNPNDSCIAIHCIAGLGRAPVMVAIALIEFGRMEPVDAVSFIRERRRGAINEKQLLYLEGYKRQYNSMNAKSGCCIIM